MNHQHIPTILWNSDYELMEGDCACCNPTTRPISSQDLSSPLWQHPAHLYYDALPDEHTLVFNPFGPGGVVVLNQAAHQVLDSYATPKPLDDTASRQLATLGLLQPAGHV